MNGKKRQLFLFPVLFSLFFGAGFCASKTINSLVLNFTRTETVTSDDNESGSSSKMTGKIIYTKNPYTFIFQIDEPEPQIMYETSKGAFFLEGDTVTEFTDGAEFLTQICQDFLNWFKDDYGLEESFFAPASVWLEEGKLLSRWEYQKHETHPIDHVIIQSDSQGRFTDLSMFIDYDSKTPVTQTSLYNFEYSTGHSYPTKVVSVSYEEEKPVLTTELYFSNIQFNSTEITEAKTYESFDLPVKDLSHEHQIISPVSPAAATYRVSIPSVLTGASFKFYKKFITNQDMTNCPFYPSCSQFMLEAVSVHGISGFFMGLERLKRCTTTEHKRNLYPTLSNGKHYDPVPPKKLRK